MARLEEKGIRITTHTDVLEILEDGLVVYDNRAKTERRIEGVDHVVWSGSNKANDELYFELKKVGIDVYRAGDCVAPRSVEYAIWEGEMLGRSI